MHWSHIADPRAEDSAIIEYARNNNYIVFTHDLDFGAILAVTGASGPSVIQVRTQDILPSYLAARLIQVLDDAKEFLESGALIVVDEGRSRIRILPLNREK
ncbi:MAG: DUF5615 family PIN-like protein [Pyrinomonadaceae bacterium]